MTISWFDLDILCTFCAEEKTPRLSALRSRGTVFRLKLSHTVAAKPIKPVFFDVFQLFVFPGFVWRVVYVPKRYRHHIWGVGSVLEDFASFQTFKFWAVTASLAPKSLLITVEHCWSQFACFQASFDVLCMWPNVPDVIFGMCWVCCDSLQVFTN